MRVCTWKCVHVWFMYFLLVSLGGSLRLSFPFIKYNRRAVFHFSPTMIRYCPACLFSLQYSSTSCLCLYRSHAYLMTATVGMQYVEICLLFLLFIQVWMSLQSKISSSTGILVSLWLYMLELHWLSLSLSIDL